MFCSPGRQLAWGFDRFSLIALLSSRGL
uniref:Uncharacterized protein n=1 Tax=Anguilla anguilla TaxID=7936 RepID=A0A0E9PJ61_ANGAN